MNRNVITILLLVCSVLVLAGGAVLYFTLSSAGSDAVSPANPPASEEPKPTTDPGAEIVIDVEETPSEGSPAEIIPDNGSLDPTLDFAFTDRSGAEHHLSEYYGKPIIINFWATWCGPCQAELPHFNRAYSQYQGQIHFLMMDLVDGSYETEESAIAFVDSQGYSFPLFFDVKGEGSLTYQIEAIPLTVVIGANGQLLTTHLGSMSEAELQELIDMALNGS